MPNEEARKLEQEIENSRSELIKLQEKIRAMELRREKVAGFKTLSSPEVGTEE